LQYLRARYYSSDTGRFLTQDSFSGYADMPQSENPYVYGLNDPTLYTDPSGYSSISASHGINRINSIMQLTRIFGGGPCVQWNQLLSNGGAESVAFVTNANAQFSAWFGNSDQQDWNIFQNEASLGYNPPTPTPGYPYPTPTYPYATPTITETPTTTGTPTDTLTPTPSATPSATSSPDLTGTAAANANATKNAPVNNAIGTAGSRAVSVGATQVENCNELVAPGTCGRLIGQGIQELQPFIAPNTKPLGIDPDQIDNFLQIIGPFLPFLPFLSG
jgi:hypothetical protein